MRTRLMLAAGVSALAAFAQVSTVVTQNGPGPNMMFYSVESAGSSKVVKGAPYSAQIVTEHTQTLADGNTISQKQTGMMYRDSEGRTRREQALGAIGPVPAAPNPPQLVFITDPVAGASYALDANNKTAHKVPLAPGSAQGATMIASGVGQAGGVVMGPGPETEMRIETHVRVGGKAAGPPPVQESLGGREIEGIQAEGTRTTITVPAGQMGNERPLVTVTERWYSAQLQATVLSTTKDPLMGESTYRLANVNLAEPAASLFEIPADYTLTEGPMVKKEVYLTK
ncbi:MAG TPA: hypothetical protein VN893_09870 [Bryobacteraceae bacterium]|nr:hypothetical protein [Bryobacteraceae bacterium]